MINYSKQLITKDDIRSVVRVLKSDYLTQGPNTKKFENRISKYCKSKFAACVSSATSGLHIGCLALGIKKDDIVWTSAISFVASANCASYCGAKVDFLDISLEDYNISVELLEKKLILAKKQNKLPKLIILVHFAGLPCEMKKIYKLKKKYNFKIMEDASHALGSKYYKDKIGDCSYSDLCVFSFHPVKSITTCEGGMVTTNNETIYNKLLIYREHGISRLSTTSHKRPKYYEQTSLGYNYRMNDVEAALGIQQLKKLDKFIKIRSKFFLRYLAKLRNPKLIMPKLYENLDSANHLFVVLLNYNNIKKRDEILSKLIKKGIGSNIHYMPIYKHPYYRKKNYLNLENSENYYKNCISIPLHQGLTIKEQDFVIKSINEIVK